MRHLPSSRAASRGLLLALCLLAPPRAGAAEDPACASALPMLLRMESYLRQNEVEGVTMDWRYAVSPSEEVRQTVVCQILGYAELYKLHPSPGIRCKIVRHGDFLLARLDSVRSHTPFDGMLGYCLLEAYACTGEARFLDAGRIVLAELMAIPTSQCRLNGGLMVAMATAKAWTLTGDTLARRKTHDIVALQTSYQNADGSFPHWCLGSKDIHYTGWMAQELNHIQRLTGDTLIEPMLTRMCGFLEARVDSTGLSHYEGPCPDDPDCTEYYYSRASGCSYDMDTRGWAVEPAYNALVFHRYQSPKYAAAMSFLLSIESGGTFPDLWDYWPPPDDPEYPWTIADTSAVTTSIMFWTLASIVTESQPCLAAEIPWDVDDDTLECPTPAPPDTTEPPPPPVTYTFAYHPPGPNPATLASEVRFTLPDARPVRIVVYDVSGRCVRNLVAETLQPGEHAVPWDLRDDAGRRCRGGLYFVRFQAGAEIRSSRVLVLP